MSPLTRRTFPSPITINWNPLRFFSRCASRGNTFEVCSNNSVRYKYNLLAHHDERYVNLQYAPVDFDKSSVLVFPDLLSEEESGALMKDIDLRVSSKRYQRGHWDAGM
jgi:hypothetical protein